MVHPRRLAAVWLFACAVSSPASAQQRLTLEDAIQRATAANPRAIVAEADVASAAARSTEARAAFLPKIDVSESWQRSDQPVFAFSSLLMQRRFSAADFALDRLNQPAALPNFHAAVSVEQVIYDSGRTAADARRADLQRERAVSDRQRTLATIRLNTVRAYARVMAAGADVRAAESAHATAREDDARVRHRRDAGLETDAAVLAMQLSTSEAEVARIRAAGEEEIARAQLNALIGAPLDVRFDIDSITAGSITPLDPALAEAEAVRNRPEVREAALAVDVAQSDVQSARRSFLPSLFALGSVEANGASPGHRASAWGAELQLRWNVFAGGRDAARARSAAALVQSAEARRGDAETALRLEARSAVISARVAAASENASRLAVDQAHESQRIIRNRYEAGLATAADLLRAADAVSRADAIRTRAIIDTRIALAELSRALGRETIQ